MLALKLPQIEYVTGAPAKRMAYSLDLPYGSHYCNAPFQKKRGPAVALVGAFSAVSSGVAMGGFLGGMMIAGGIASGLGALTGNKTLSNIGMGLSLAGGIAGAFTDTAGNFVNPFSEATKFGDTALGSGIEKMKSGVKNFFSDVGAQPTSVGDGLVKAAQTNGTEGLASTAANTIESTGSLVRDVNNNVISGGSLAQKVGDNLPGGGLLSSLSNNTGALNILGGLADGYNNYQELEIKKPLYEAQTRNANANADATNAQTGLLQSRQENMQAQPEVGLGVNQNAQVFSNTPQPGTNAGKYAVVLNGEVRYLSQAEYDALKQQQSSSGSGMLSTGATA